MQVYDSLIEKPVFFGHVLPMHDSLGTMLLLLQKLIFRMV
jgi:hypothetical protein